MRKEYWICIAIALVVFSSLGCSATSTGENDHDHSSQYHVEDGETAIDQNVMDENEVKVDEEEQKEPEPEPEPEPYSLEIAVEMDGDHYVLIFETDLILSKENYEGDHVEGEGHLHYFRNNRLVGPITDYEPIILERLQEGENVVRLDLAKNDHTSYRVSREVRFINELE